MTNDIITSFGYWLRRRRLSLDLTQAELATRVGCSESAIRKIERDERRPSASIAEQLATVLGITAQDQPLFRQVARGEKSPERLAALDAPTFTPLPATLSPATLPPVPPRTVRLPNPTTPFIGRTGEVAEIQQLLGHLDCRLLTIVGPGGIGKTRLALAVAAAQETSYRGQVYFAALAALQSPRLLTQALATAIGFTFSGYGEPEQQLLTYLRHKRLLLLLDNVEHLLHPADPVAEADTVGALLAKLIEGAPELKILATAREPLGVQGEWLFTLQGLSVPPITRHQPPTNEFEYSALALALQCARRIQPELALSPATYADLTRICRLVDGMPLGIELATAWGRTLSYGEIADEIERNIDFLTAHWHDLPVRHRSLRATFDYSWQLLTNDERQVLTRLTLLVGAFEREAAHTVAQAGLPVLAALVAKSLVRRVDDATSGAAVSATRYELHELVRQFAAAKGEVDPVDQAATQQRHAHYFAQVVIKETTTLTSANQQAALQRLTYDLANIRQAWGWLVAQGQADQLRRMAWPLWYFFELRNTFQAGETLFAQGQAALLTRQMAGVTDPALVTTWANLHTHQAFFAFRQGRTEQALSWLTAAVGQLRHGHDQTALIDALWAYGAVCWFLGQFDEAATALREALRLCRTQPLPWQQAVNSTFLGIVLYEQGAYAESYRLLHDGLLLARALGDPRPIAFAGSFLSRTAQALGRYGEMMALLHEGLRLARESDDRFGMGVALEQLALGSHALGQLADGARFLTEGMQLYRAIGDSWSLARLLTYAGNLALAQDDTEAAERAFAEALTLAIEANVPPNALDALVGLATVRIHQGDELAALTLVEIVIHHPAATQGARQRAGQLQDDLTRQLSTDQIALAQERGLALRDISRWLQLLAAPYAKPLTLDDPVH